MVKSVSINDIYIEVNMVTDAHKRKIESNILQAKNCVSYVFLLNKQTNKVDR